jgi:hypothetical protein
LFAISRWSLKPSSIAFGSSPLSFAPNYSKVTFIFSIWVVVKFMNVSIPVCLMYLS